MSSGSRLVSARAWNPDNDQKEQIISNFSDPEREMQLNGRRKHK